MSQLARDYEHVAQPDHTARTENNPARKTVQPSMARIATDRGDLTVSGPKTKGGVKNVDGVMVSETRKAGLLVGAQEVRDGVQFLSAFTGPEAPDSVSYRLDLPENVQLRPTENGGVEFVRDARSGGPEEILGHIRAPWATDADGNDVPTRYEVRGSTLIQHVDHSNAAYPVVADPWVSYGWRIYLNFTHWDVHDIVDHFGAQYWGATAVAGYVCTYASAGTMVAICLGVVGGAAWSIWQTILDADAAHECFQLGMPYSPGAAYPPPSWNVLNC